MIAMPEILDAQGWHAATADYQREALQVNQMSSNFDDLASYMHSSLGSIETRLKMWESAEQNLLSGYEIAESSVDFRSKLLFPALKLGHYYRQVKRTREATKYYEEVLKLTGYDEKKDQLVSASPNVACFTYEALTGQLLCRMSENGCSGVVDSEIQQVLKVAEK